MAKFFRSKGWKAFWPNFLAVVLGIVLTFGGERLISGYQDRRMAGELIGIVEADTRTHIEEAGEWVRKWTPRVRNLTHAYRLHRAKKGFGGMPTDSLQSALRIFFGVRAYTPRTMGIDQMADSHIVSAVGNPEAIDALAKLAGILVAYREQQAKLQSEIERAMDHLCNEHRLERGEKTPLRRHLEYRMRMLLNDNACAALIANGKLKIYLRMFDDMSRDMQRQLDRLEAAGY